MNWNDVRYFLVTADTGNLTEAAKLMKTSPSTVARRIRELETSYGVALFSKLQSGYVLTPAGASLRPHAERVAAEMRFLERHAASVQDAPQPRVKIELPELLGAYVIVPGLADVAGAMSSVRFDITNAARTTRLAERSCDLVMRLARPDSGDYTAKKIGQLSRALYAAPGYLADRKCGPDIDSFADHNLIGWSDDFDHMGTSKWFRETTDHAPLWMQTANVRLQIDAVIAGLGIAALPKCVGDHHKLVPIKTNTVSSLSAEIWLLRRSDTLDLPQVSKCVHWIEAIVTSKNQNLCF